MLGYTKIQIMGNLGGTPEMKYSGPQNSDQAIR